MFYPLFDVAQRKRHVNGMGTTVGTRPKAVCISSGRPDAVTPLRDSNCGLESREQTEDRAAAVLGAGSAVGCSSKEHAILAEEQAPRRVIAIVDSVKLMQCCLGPRPV